MKKATLKMCAVFVILFLSTTFMLYVLLLNKDWINIYKSEVNVCEIKKSILTEIFIY